MTLEIDLLGPNPSNPAVPPLGSMTIVVSGELDAASAPVLRSALTQLAADGAVSIVIDAADLSFVDAAGLGVLVAADRRLRGAGGGLRLANPSSGVRRALTMTGLLGLVDVSATDRSRVGSPVAAATR